MTTRITQQEFDKLRDIDKIMIHTSVSHRSIQTSLLLLIGVIAGLFSIHNLFLFNIFSTIFFFIIEFGFICLGVFLDSKTYNIIHSRFFDSDGKVKESYLKKYKIKN